VSKFSGEQYSPTDTRSETTIGGAGFGRPEGFVVPEDHFHHPGYPVPSDTWRWGDQGTEWPVDAFTGMILAPGPHPISRPMPHSYAEDGNMEAYVIAGPYCQDNEAATDLGAFTGATGPTGHVTPINHPELTAPRSASTTSDISAPAQSGV
jgi:hypothetical protein